MKLGSVIVINTVLAAVFGIAFLLVPARVVLWYGVTPDPPLTYTAQLVGAALIAFVLLTWPAADSDARKGVVLALFVGHAIGFIVAFTAQLLGAALIAFALLTWLARNATDSDARKSVVLALFIGHAIGFIVALVGQFNDVINTLGWLNVVIYLILTLCVGYLLFVRTASRQRAYQATKNGDNSG